MFLTPKTELVNRIAQLQQHLTQNGLDGALLHGVTNVYYYSGTAQQSHLWVPAAGAPVLLVRRVLERARRESALDRVEPIGSLRQLPEYIGTGRRIGMELDILPVSLFAGYQRALPGVEIVDIGPATRLARAVKSDVEIAQVRGAARVADLTFQAIKAALREGMTELELSAIAEAAERRHGFQGMVRWRAATGFECPWFHVLAGESGAVASFADTTFGGEGLTPAAPYGAGYRQIQRGMPVVVDYPTAYNGYIHDGTRTLAIGSLPDDLVRAYNVSVEIAHMFQTEARPGVTGEELWQKSVSLAEQHGLLDHFQGYGPSKARFVGHGVGLELDELPILAPRQQHPLEPGNVIAIEPKFFFPGRGAVGIENTYLITPQGAERLTLTGEELVLV
ncbi:MAG: M24 family metallopeptidase [Mycobacterium leprae]